MDQIKQIKEVVNNIYWSLVLQGVAFVLLAVLIILYPVLLVALVSAGLLVIGVSLLVFAYKIRKFWNNMPSILK